MIETVFLDAGGVLIHPNFDRVAHTLAQHGVNTSGGELSRAEPLAKRDLEDPAFIKSSDDDSRGLVYFAAVLRRAGIPVDDHVRAALRELRDYHGANNLWESVPGDLRPFLDRLRSRGLRRVVVSNANGTLHAHFERLGLTPYFDAIFDSHVEKVEKPDPRFFEIALDRSASRKETTVHVGDFYEIDVVGARRAGLEAILLDPANVNTDRDCVRVRSLDELATHFGA
ncbi:MAG: HAD-IA family hydrolase [Vicinamibacteria bacterium]|nr:HAD-IA family hydrolase [Vicinamibacteria bacterium]